MTCIALYFAFRTSGPVQVASANPAPTLSAPVPVGSATPVVAPTPTLSPADSAVVVLDDVADVPAPEPKTGATTPAVATPAPVNPVAKPYQPSSSVPVSSKKPGGNRKDIYKPF